MEQVELAINIINLKIAKEIKENKEKEYDKFKEKIVKLENERNQIYLGNKEIINKVIEKYLKEVKEQKMSEVKNEKYDLTKEEFESSLKMAELALLMRTKTSDKPKSIFIVSQAGGGKTGLKAFVEAEKQREQTGDLFVEINPDEVAIYHKYYEQILKEFPNESYAKLQKFILPALDQYLRQRAVQLRNNIIQEGTFGSTEGYLEILNFQRNGGKAKIGNMQENGEREEVEVKGGYDVEIDVLAVDRFESLLSSYEREQRFIELNLPPRAVTAENHDRAYNKMLETLQQIDDKKLYDKIRVFKRGKIETTPELVYTAGEKTYPNVVECIKQTRNEDRKRLFANSEDYLKRIESLKSRVKTKIQMDKITKLEQEFCQLLAKEQEEQEQK